MPNDQNVVLGSNEIPVLVVVCGSIKIPSLYSLRRDRKKKIKIKTERKSVIIKTLHSTEGRKEKIKIKTERKNVILTTLQSTEGRNYMWSKPQTVRRIAFDL